jgi:hypothetical protein
MSQITIQLHPKLPPLPDQQTVLRMLTLFIAFCLPELGNAGEEPFTSPVFVVLLPARGHEVGMTTGAYNPGNGRIYSRAEGRALVDIMRTVAHELVHQRQDELAELAGKNHPDIGGRVENEANAVAGMLIKEFVLRYDCKWIHGL